jgi:lipoprotein-anchoring transpeptidase ErfK/SrfK
MTGLRGIASITCVAMIAMGAAVGVQNFYSNPALQARAQSAIESAENFVGIARPVPVAVVQKTKPVRVASNAVQVPVVAPTPTTASPAQTPAPAPVQTDQYALQADAVAQRVKDSVPPELFSYFHTYLYVSKAANGAWAQHMFVFHRADNGRLVLDDTFPVSTGREQHEKYFTSTPVGLFELDPNRFDANHRSHRWHNAPMPWAMFLNFTIHGHPAGIALHSGIGHVADLGHRASGGCVRMPPEKAEEYFKKFKAEEFGEVPVFAFDGDTTGTDGKLVRDTTGKPEMTEGYKVLLIIQNYPGGPVTVAMLS